MKKRQGKKKIDTIEKLAAFTVSGFKQVESRFEQMDGRFEKLAALTVEGFEQVDRRFEQVDQQIGLVREEIRQIRNELADINRRIEHLEEQGARQAGYAKEIDYLIARVSALEKEVKVLKAS